VGLNSLKSLNLTNVYRNNKKKKKKNNNNNKVKSKPELAPPRGYLKLPFCTPRLLIVVVLMIYY
jgi:hypothetical protein